MRLRLSPFTASGVEVVQPTPSITGGTSVTQSSGTTTAGIPQYDSDPASPNTEDAWVLKTGGVGGAGAGEPIGLLLALTQSGGGSPTYQFSYRTLENTTIRVTLS